MSEKARSTMLGVRITRSELDALHELAFKENKTLSALIRKVLQDYAKREHRLDIRKAG